MLSYLSKLLKNVSRHFFVGEKPKYVNLLIATHEACNAVKKADEPGIGTIFIHNFRASDVSLKAGSDIHGVQASDTKAIDFHSSRNEINLSTFMSQEWE